MQYNRISSLPNKKRLNSMKSTCSFKLSPTLSVSSSVPTPPLLKSIQTELANICFSVQPSTTSLNRQLNSSLDDAIIKHLKIFGEIETNSIVEDDDGKIGLLDFVLTLKDSPSVKYYVEIEKTDKKRLWFDFIKILTCLKSDTNGKGLIICPKNYAHSNGVWDLFAEAQNYKTHLERVFEKHSDLLKRVFIIGYEQLYKNPNGKKFARYTSLHYKKIKDFHKE